jgi:ABC-type multidrug transport system fused ATPase/permease subunit
MSRKYIIANVIILIKTEIDCLANDIRPLHQRNQWSCNSIESGVENALDSQHTTQVDTRERSTQRSNPLLDALRRHWPEYVMEGAELGLFMISACTFVVLLEYPTSPVHQAIPDFFLRRVLIGIAMGLTAIGIIYSPLGQRSGAHFNPSVTLTFFRLGKVELWDASSTVLLSLLAECWESYYRRSS